MKIIAAVITAILMGACASTSDGSKSNGYMPHEGQLEQRNPYLLKCPANSAPVCDVWGTGERKQYDNCRCVRR